MKEMFEELVFISTEMLKGTRWSPVDISYLLPPHFILLIDDLLKNLHAFVDVRV